jgi:putative cell wall-binding protein
MTNESASSHGQNQRKSTLNHNSDNLEKSRKFRWSSCFSFISKIKKNNKQTRIRASQSYEALDQDDKDDNKITELIEGKIQQYEAPRLFIK